MTASAPEVVPVQVPGTAEAGPRPVADAETDVDDALTRLLLVGDRLRGALASRAGVTAIESIALTHLALAGPLTQRALGDCVGLSTGAVTGLVDRLEKHGVCRREPHPSDRRASYVTLTDHGRGVLAHATAQLTAAAEVVPGTRRPTTAQDLTAIADAMGAALVDVTSSARARRSEQAAAS